MSWLNPAAPRSGRLPRRPNGKHVARRDLFACRRRGSVAEEPAGIDRGRRSGRDFRRQPLRTVISSPMPSRRASQSVRIAGKPAPRPTAQPPAHGARTALRTAAAARYRRRAAFKIGRRICRCGGWLSQLTPMPMATRNPLPAARLRSECRRTLHRRSSRSFGHLKRECGASAGALGNDGVAQRQSRDESEFRRAFGRRRIAQQELA